MSRFEYAIPGPYAYSADPCVPADNTTTRLTTDDGIEYVRTPEEAFVDLAENGYPWEPNYVMIEGMRMHYVDVGPRDATETVLLLHGQPSWSFLYRKMIPVLEERGFRVIALDWLGMGRSDKPVDLEQHTYLKQVDRLKEFIPQAIPQALEEPTITLFIQDWGSLIGFRVAGDEPGWFRRIVSANGILYLAPKGNTLTIENPINYNCSDTRNFIEMGMSRYFSAPCGDDTSCFSIWANYALTSPTLTASEALDAATTSEMSPGALAQYDAPFPSFIYKAAIRAFPSMAASVHEPEFGNLIAWESLGNFTRPYLSLAGENDPSLGSPQVQSLLISHIPGASIHDFEHKRYANAHHFIQEDVGAEMAAYVADFMEGTPVMVEGSVGTSMTEGSVGTSMDEVDQDMIGGGEELETGASAVASPAAHLGTNTSILFIVVLFYLRKIVS